MRYIQIITLFPEMVQPVLDTSMLWKAQKEGAVTFEVIQLRNYGKGPRKQVDDPPYGGGDGMLLMIEPLVAAIEDAKSRVPDSITILPTPRGKLFKQSDAKQLAGNTKNILLVCPRYEGYDERIVNWIDEQYCIGPYVLTGGELPALVIIDAVVRLLPGVLGGETSAEFESFQQDNTTIEYPHYTRPIEFRGLKVPEILLSGHHEEIEKWRQKNQK